MRKPALVISLLLIVGFAGFARWRRGHDPARASLPGVLLISGDTTGWITPCGCTANQSGGLLRRGTYLQQARKTADVAYADVGGAPAGTSAYQAVKFESIIAGELKMGLVAHNIGGPEARLGSGYLRNLASTMHVPFISANTTSADGQEIAPPSKLLDVGSRRVLLIGVLSQRFATDDVRVGEPKEAVLRSLTSAQGKYDVAVVLAYLPEDELQQLSRDLPEIDAVVGGPTGQALAPRAQGPSLLAAATNKGKFLVRLNLFLPADASPRPQSDAAHHPPLTGEIAEMKAGIADDPAQAQNLQQFLKLVGERDYPASQTGFAPSLPPGTGPTYRIAGSASCATCHANDDHAWAASGHAHAWAALKPRGFEVDPYCLQCHTTGYGLPGGFDSLRRTPALVDVGCENCHGPSQAHVNDPKVHTAFIAADECVRCHDHENSPAFNYPVYWSRIRHGGHAQTLPSASAPTSSHSEMHS